jgi:predicted transcriptional regulator
MGLQEDIRSEMVSELPQRPVITVTADAAVREAVQLMIAHSCGAVFLLNDDGKPDGKFTERMLIKLMASGKPFMDDKVGDHREKFWAMIRHNEPISNLIHKLQTYGLRHVCVVDDDGKPVGRVGQRSIMEYMADHFPRAVKAQLADAKLFMAQREGA